ncbi:MAG: hypothetical protein HYX94_11740 [Chloroflexi bacterium]|nr:hypothetical protein [Chloroflexota bacterium]
MAKLWAFWLASLVCPLVPRRVGCLVAGFLGSLTYFLAPGARRVVQDNLRVVLSSGAPADKVAWLARGVFRNTAKNYFELCWLRKLDMDKFDRLVRMEGHDNLLKAIDEGRGVVVVTAHLGNFDICGQGFAVRSHKVTAILEPLKPPQLFDLVQKLRGSKGVAYVPVGPSALKEAIRSLRRGGIVVVACDRDIQKTGVQVPFFGQMASLPVGAAQMAVHTGARIVPIFSERLPDDSFVVHFDPPLEIDGAGNGNEATKEALGCIAAAMERRIAAHPEQWVVFERIWPELGQEKRVDRHN